MKITKINNLSFYNEQGILTLTAKQFDTGRMFAFHIVDNDMPFDLSGCTAYLRIAKADGTQFQGHECCTVEGSKIIINTSVGNGSQILSAAGINTCELHLKDASDIALTTWTFHIVVEPRVHNGSHISSIDSYDVLDNMINMEKERIANEEQRKENEENRKTIFNQKISETNSVITECQLVIDTATQKINSFDEEINEIVDGITDEAQSYANNAKVSETNAANAASSAADSANTASQKADSAASSAALSQSYAVGGTQIRAGEDADNAKYYSQKAQETLQKLQETTVTSIKGNAESTYRTGDVNLTPEHIGLGNVNNTSDADKPVSISQQAAIDTKVSKSGDTMNGNLEMTNHSINNVLSINGTVGENDFWRISGGDTGSNAGYLEIATADDATEPIYVRQYTGVYANKAREATLLDENGNTSFPGWVTAPVFQGQATAIRDSGDGRTLTFNYSAEGLNDTAWLAAWNGNELRGYALSKLSKAGHTHSYLPTAGGTITGNFSVNTNSGYEELKVLNKQVLITDIEFKCVGEKRRITYSTSEIEFSETNDDDISINAGGYIYFYAGKENIGCISVNGIEPAENSKYDLGSNYRKWRNIYATNGTIQTSDRNEKNSIEKLSDEKAQAFIYGLKPSSYKMNAGTSNRTHWGIVSQDIEELIEEIGMTSSDFAGFIKFPKTKIITEDENGKKLRKPIEKIIEGEYNYGLRYDEFIAPMIKVMQTQHMEIQLQNEKLKVLEQKINFLEQKIRGELV